MRNRYNTQVNETLLNEIVTVSGWVHRRRDHGGVIFVDLRDASGLIQVVFNPSHEAMFAQAEKLRNESVLSVTGLVSPRPDGTINENLATGKIELMARELDVHNIAEPVPFQIEDEQVSDEVRLRYRYLDLRREQMNRNLRLRHQVTRIMRNYLDNNQFVDIETPILTKSTPEGARDYLVPSRTHQGEFFALPQSPQLFKQLLMMSGMDRYYQLARCFRDEDLRADRQPEFTQLDIEVSFMDEHAVMDMMEGMTKQIFKETLGLDFDTFPKMPYNEAIQKYGVDRPDLRNPLLLVDVDDLLTDIEFKVFATPAKDPKSRVVAMRVPQGGQLSRKEIDEYTKYVDIYGAKGLAYIKVNDVSQGIEGLQSPIVKFFPEQAMDIVNRVQATDGDLIFFGADKAKIVNEAMGALRVKLGEDMKLLTCDWSPVWVVDFPMFEQDDKTGKQNAIHHPFTLPKLAGVDLNADEAPDNLLSRAYDLVINGIEVGGGSERIYKSDVQATVFKWLGISDEEAQEKFGFFLEAMQFGCPPHAGMAFGLDRLVMLLGGMDSIREVIAFPKTQSAACPLTFAPSNVDFTQLRELGLKINKPKTEDAQLN